MIPLLYSQAETILTKDITVKQLVVAVTTENVPCILSKGYTEEPKRFSFNILFNQGDNIITSGNGYDINSDYDTPKLMVEYAMRHNWKVAVFEQCDWKDALKWLIANTI